MRSKSLAIALILLTILGSGSWHVESDDPDFLPPATGHDHSTHHEAFKIPAASEAGGHCAICHWLQIFRTSPTRDARVYIPAGQAGLHGVAAVAALRSAALFDVPSRAPPA